MIFTSPFRPRTPIVLLLVLACIGDRGQARPATSLRVVIVRHGEKPDDGDQLSCEGQNRALKLPEVLVAKYGIPAATYVPALGLGAATSHARMFQTVAPLAIKHNLPINTRFDEKDAAGVAAEVLARQGTILLVWEHTMIPELAKQLGVASPPKWKGRDFDGIWVITYANGMAALAIDREGITPSAECSY
jgi:hypothetical protein